MAGFYYRISCQSIRPVSAGQSGKASFARDAAMTLANHRPNEARMHELLMLTHRGR